MGIIGDLTVRIAADTSSLTSGVGSASSSLQGLIGIVGGMNPLVGVIAGIGAAAVGFGVASVSAAGDFQQSASKIQAYAGLSAQATDKMKQSILDMSTQVGLKPKELADALYPIVSSGYSASESLSILKLSAETAAASGAKTSVVADALTTSLKSMHAPASQAGLYMDYINKMCSLGKGEIPQYANVIGKLSLSAGGAGVDFKTMGATLATLTTHGFPSVAQASTALGNLYTQIGPKVDNLTQHAKKLGLSFDENAFKTMSFGDKMNYLNKVTGGNQGEMLKLLGGNTLALKSFNALEGSTKDFTANLDAMGKAQGSTAAVFATASQNYNFNMQKLGAAFDVLKISVGNALLPILTKVVSAVAPIIASFADWLTKSNAVGNGISFVQGLAARLWPTLQDIGKQLSPLLNQIQNWTAKNDVAGKSAQALTLIVDGISAALKFAVPYLVEMIKEFSQFDQEVGERLMPILSNLDAWWREHWPAMKEVFTGVWEIIQGVFKSSWAQITGNIKVGLDLLSGNWKKAWEDIQASSKTSADGGKQIISGYGQYAKGIVDNMLISTGIMKTGIQRDTDQAAKQTQINSLSMKKAMVDNTIAMQKESLNHIDIMIEGIADRLKKAKDPAEKHTLEMQLVVLQHTRTMKDGAIHDAQLQKDGIDEKLNALKNSSASIWGDTVKKIQDIISGAKKWITDTWTNIVNWVADKFKWLYDKNYYFHDLVDSIRKAFTDAETWIHTTWNNITTWLAAKWNDLVKSAQDLWTKIAKPFQDAWSQHISPALTNLWTSITGWWSNTVVPAATKLGGDVINAIGSGITNAAGAVGTAVQNAINGALSGAGFHDLPGMPKSTPGHARGILNSPTSHWAVVGEQGPELMYVPQGSNIYPNGANPNFSYGGTSSGGGGGSSEQHIHVHIGNDEVAHYVTDKQMKMVRLGGYRR